MLSRNYTADEQYKNRITASIKTLEGLLAEYKRDYKSNPPSDLNARLKLNLIIMALTEAIAALKRREG